MIVLPEANPLVTQINYEAWRVGLFFGLLFSIALFVRSFSIPLSAKLLWVYAAGSALYLLEWPSHAFGIWHTVYRADAGSSLAAILLIPALCLKFPGIVRRLIPWIAITQVVMLWWLKWGLMYRESADTALLALCLPFLSPLVVIAGIITIVSHQGFTGPLMFVVQVIALYSKKVQIWCYSAMATIGGGLFFMFPHHRAGWDERIALWGRMMKLWEQDWITMVFGNGAGSFVWTSLMRTEYVNGTLWSRLDNGMVYYPVEFNSPLLITMHNDPLQLIFDFGIIGGILVLLTLLRCRVTPALAGSMVFAVTYHPLHYFPSAMIFTFSLILSCKQRSLSSDPHTPECWKQ